MGSDCCNQFGHHLYNGATLGKGFPPDTRLLRVRTNPGDVLTFGSFSHHIVATDPGPVFMQTYRILDKTVVWAGIKKFGIEYLKALYDTWKNNNKRTTANQANDEEKSLRKYCTNCISKEDYERLKEKESEYGKYAVVDN